MCPRHIANSTRTLGLNAHPTHTSTERLLPAYLTASGVPSLFSASRLAYYVAYEMRNSKATTKVGPAIVSCWRCSTATAFCRRSAPDQRRHWQITPCFSDATFGGKGLISELALPILEGWGSGRTCDRSLYHCTCFRMRPTLASCRGEARDRSSSSHRHGLPPTRH